MRAFTKYQLNFYAQFQLLCYTYPIKGTMYNAEKNMVTIRVAQRATSIFRVCTTSMKRDQFNSCGADVGGVSPAAEPLSWLVLVSPSVDILLVKKWNKLSPSKLIQLNSRQFFQLVKSAKEHTKKSNSLVHTMLYATNQHDSNSNTTNYWSVNNLSLNKYQLLYIFLLPLLIKLQL